MRTELDCNGMLKAHAVCDSTVNLGLTQTPTHEHVHSHDFNRYLTTFRAVFDPKDCTERRLVCGRYISEAIMDLPLKPVDIIDAKTGMHGRIRHASMYRSRHSRHHILPSSRFLDIDLHRYKIASQNGRPMILCACMRFFRVSRKNRRAACRDDAP